MRTFKLMGALPGLIHREPRRALMITFGAGIAAGTAANFFEGIECVELVDDVAAIAGYFSLENGDVLGRGKISLHINDARHHLLTTGNTYSAVVADATHPRGYDSWVLFTREFYELVRERLEPGGLFCQWVPLHGMGLAQYMAIIRTFLEAFPHTSVWSVDQSHSLLVGTSEPLRIDFRRLREELNRIEVRDDLAEVGLDDPYSFLSCFDMGEGMVHKMLAGYPGVVTDNGSQHLFFPLKSTPDEQYRKWPARNHRQLRLHEESVLSYLVNTGNTENQRKAVSDRIRMHRSGAY
jgi:spermidine synthase